MVASLACCLVSNLALAQATTQYGDSTFGRSTWSRPLEDGSALANRGTDVSFHVQELQVPPGGAGTATITASWDFDGFLLLYGNGFVPFEPLVNFIAGDDDYNGMSRSRIVVDLAEGVSYFLVSTGYNDFDSGPFSIEISSSVQLTLVERPLVWTVDPQDGSTNGGENIIIEGTRFLGATGATIGGDSCSTFQVNGDSRISCQTEPALPGPASVEVAAPSGSSPPGTVFFTFVDPLAVPIVTEVNPPEGAEAGGYGLLITGSGFVGVTDVTVGGAPCQTFFAQSGTTIFCLAPPGRGVASVEVTNANGTSLPNALFSYFAPVVYSGDTEGGLTWERPNEAGTSIRTGFVSYDAQEIEVPAGSSGTYTITAQWDGGQDGFLFLYDAFNASAPLSAFVDGDDDYNGIHESLMEPLLTGGARYFIIATGYSVNDYGPYTVEIAGPGKVRLVGTSRVPTVTAVRPSTGSTFGDERVVIEGANLSGTTNVTFAGAVATFNVLSNTAVEATTPAGTLGPASVEVTTVNGVSAPNALFNYVNIVPPTVTSVDPDRGSTSGGTFVSITGSGLTGTTTVTFAGALATDVTVLSDTEVTAITPPGSVGPVSVLVSNRAGTSAPNAFFSYGDPVAPTVTHVEPPTGSISGGTLVTVSGTDFVGVSSVTFDGHLCVGLHVIRSTALTCINPAHGAGAVSVAVTTPLGTSGPNTLFTYEEEVQKPEVTVVEPSSGPVTGGTPVTVTGNNFVDGNTVVTFGGNPATNIVWQNETKLSCETPPGAPGAVSVEVVTPGGASDPNRLFSYGGGGAPPQVVSIEPKSGPAVGGTRVTIRGASLIGTVSVIFGDRNGTEVEVVSATEVRAVTPMGRGVVPVVVSSPAGSSAENVTFEYIAAPPKDGEDEGGCGCRSQPRSQTNLFMALFRRSRF